MNAILKYMLMLAASLAALSCQRDYPATVPPQTTRTVSVVPVTLSMEASPFEGEETKSRISSDTETIRRAMLFAMGSDGRILLRENEDGSTSPIVTTVSASEASSFEWGIPLGTTTVYAIANYDDALRSVLEGYAGNKELTVSTLEALTYTNDESSFLTGIPAHGMPMAGVNSITVSSAGQELSFSVKKLFARYELHFDTSAFTSAGLTVTATAIEGLTSPSSAYWFREGVSPSGVSYVNLDYATQSDLAQVSSSGCILYLMENCQGNREGFSHWYDVQFAPSSVLSGLTNLLIKITYTDGGGHTRKSVCRVFLGRDCQHNFDVQRGVSTRLNLSLRPGIGKEVYLGDGSTIVSGPFATITIPFETTLQESNQLAFSSLSDISFQSFTFAPKSGGEHPECGFGGTVTYVANANARAASFSSLSVQGASADDIYDEAEVYFPYSFSYRWEGGTAPDHVAQRNLLHCIDNYTGTDSAAGIFSATDPARVRLVSNGDGTAWVSLLSPFAATAGAIGIEAAGGEGHADVPLEARLPFFSCTAPQTSYVDASSSMTYKYLQADGSGHSTNQTLSVRPAESATGLVLSQELVEELIPPELGSVEGRIGYRRELSADGTYALEAWLQTYDGLSSLLEGTAAYFVADRIRVGMTGYAGMRSPQEAPFNAWNPWKDIHHAEPVQVGVLDDYTLYREPAAGSGSMAGAGWSQTAVRPFGKEQENVSVSVRNPIVARTDRLQIRGRFADGAGLSGSILSGTPGATPANGNYSEWTLRFNLKERTAAEWGTHNAGKMQVSLRLSNAYDNSILETAVAEACIRLHLYVWPSVSGPYLATDAQGLSRYRQFKVMPYADTRGYEIYGLEQVQPAFGSRFFQIPVLAFESQIQSQGVGICDSRGALSGAGAIRRTASSTDAAVTYQIAGSQKFGNEGDSDSVCMQNLRSALRIASEPYSFRGASNVSRNGETFYGLDHYLGNGSYTRSDDYTLYYDPSGNAGTYSYGTGTPRQLFVFHLGDTGFGMNDRYYFAPENGF